MDVAASDLADTGVPRFMKVTSFAPGRVNVIGEHTDYTGGLVLPLALDRGVTISGRRGGGRLTLRSEQLGSELDVALPVRAGDESGTPDWARYALSSARHLGFSDGLVGTIESSLPAGGTGLSSSSALTVALMLAMGALAEDTLAQRKELAETARIIENSATGVRSGIMDQLISLTGLADHAVMIDCRTLDLTPVTIPRSMEVLVFHSGQPRILADSEYNDRLESCERIEQQIGPLRDADLDDVETLADETLRKRARHVVSENLRVCEMMEALEADDPAWCGRILNEGHRSLSDDYEVSTPVVDAIRARVADSDGIFGARMVGGGFGGSLVALCEPGTELDIPTWWLRARPGPGANVQFS